MTHWITHGIEHVGNASVRYDKCEPLQIDFSAG